MKTQERFTDIAVGSRKPLCVLKSDNAPCPYICEILDWKDIGGRRAGGYCGTGDKGGSPWEIYIHLRCMSPSST